MYAWYAAWLEARRHWRRKCYANNVANFLLTSAVKEFLK